MAGKDWTGTTHGTFVTLGASKRLTCAMNGDFNMTNGSAACYAWFVWEKDLKGDIVVRWIN